MARDEIRWGNMPWRTRWIKSQHKNAHIAVAFPGGAAAERILSGIHGWSHLLEHLYYRQNIRAGRLLDQIGCRLGQVTDAEVMMLSICCAPEDTATVCSLLVKWWSEMVIDERDLAIEIRIVSDEVRRVKKDNAAHLHQRIWQMFLPNSHFSADYAGTPESLAEVELSTLCNFQQKIRQLGGAIVVLSPEPPWNDAPPDGAPWCPNGYTPTPPKADIQFQLPAGQLCMSLGARLGPGLTDPDLPFFMAAFAALDCGRLHPAQQTFHDRLNLRYLSPSLEIFSTTGLFMVTAHCSITEISEVAQITAQLISEPLLDSSAERLHQLTRLQTSMLLDDPRAFVLAAARRLLHGALLPHELHEAAELIPLTQVEGRIESMWKRWGDPLVLLGLPADYKT